MRNVVSKLSALLLLSTALLNSCQNATSPGTQANGSMVATVNGQSWSSVVVPGVTAGTVAFYNRSSGTTTITGTSVDLTGHTQTIGLVLIHRGVGADSLGFGNTGTWSNGIPGEGSFVTAGFNAGVVNMTAYDTVNHRLSGNFNFVAHQANNLSNTVTVTNGSFVNVSYTEQ